MRKAFPHALAFWVCLLSTTALQVRGQTLAPLTHPNHYIVLIDSSSSMVTSANKKSAFEKALFGTLLKRIYQEGFGEKVPAYVPEQDYLTLHHFGVVVGDSATAYTRLADYDLLTQFIHTSFIRKKGVTADALRERIYPAQFYNYTVLSWAKPLALRASAPVSSDNVGQRTFLIIIHDGLPNENSLAEEVRMIHRWSKENGEKVQLQVNEIDDAYRFTDGNGDNRPAWSEQFQAGTDQGSPIFVEAYEVNSKSQSHWEAAGLKLHPVDALEIQWQKESGAAPQGVLTVSLRQEFEAWIKQADSPQVSLSVKADGHDISQPGLKLPFVVQGDLSCEPRLFNTALNISLSQSDKFLGSRTLNYTYPQTVAAPLPMRCTLTFILAIVLAAILAILLLAALIYYVYYRFYGTHLEIQIPGLLMPISLQRNVQIVAPAQLVPQQGLEALSLKLPSLLKQFLFCRGAVVTIAADAGQNIHWANGSNEALVKLPSAYEYISAHWDQLPDKPSLVNLKYQQGKQSMGVTLSYPGGAPENSKGVQK
jgi:hypothetical protein